MENNSRQVAKLHDDTTIMTPSSKKKAAHVKWNGTTIALGSFPTIDIANHDHIERAKEFTELWRSSTSSPKPTVEWVKHQLEVYGIRVVNYRAGRRKAGESDDVFIRQQKRLASSMMTIQNNFSNFVAGTSYLTSTHPVASITSSTSTSSSNNKFVALGNNLIDHDTTRGGDPSTSSLPARCNPTSYSSGVPIAHDMRNYEVKRLEDAGLVPFSYSSMMISEQQRVTGRKRGMLPEDDHTSPLTTRRVFNRGVSTPFNHPRQFFPAAPRSSSLFQNCSQVYFPPQYQYASNHLPYRRTSIANNVSDRLDERMSVENYYYHLNRYQLQSSIEEEHCAQDLIRLAAHSNSALLDVHQKSAF